MHVYRDYGGRYLSRERAEATSPLRTCSKKSLRPAVTSAIGSALRRGIMPPEDPLCERSECLARL